MTTMTQRSFFLLPKINSPQDLKKLTLKELNQLAQEIREKIISAVASNGGHLASNLGAVELSIALHRVFNSPEDKIVWDVGHQCYAHKLLTGRYSSFSSLRKYGGLAGFPKCSESPHDAFNTGHASTSISAALGLLAAERMLGGNGHAIAVIGDGALTGGLAYEALSHAGHLGLPLIVVLNDNKMSISANVGGLSKYLSRLSMKKNYQIFRRNFDALAKKIPFVGEAFFDLILRLKRAVKAVFYTDNFFVDLGFEYVGPIGGHNIQALTDILEDVRKLNRPVVIHVITRKGKGYGYAEDDPDNYHGVGSFSVDGGIAQTPAEKKQTFTGAFSNAMIAAARRDKRLVAVTAAMQTGTGLTEFASAFPGRFFDVGIAEEHAVTFAAGLAARGLKPVVAIYSTFIQRAVDQVIHDAALQKLSLILALDRAGFVGADGETHQGLFDIALFRSAPNTSILCPASENEMRLMLDWALEQDSGPVIIRYPKTYCPSETHAFSLPVEKGRGVWLSKNNGQVCLIFTGSLYRQTIEAAAILKEQGIEADLYNLRFIKPIDEDYLAGFLNNYKLAVFIEEGIREGGFGEYAAAFAQRNGCKAQTAALAAQSSFLEEDRALGNREELLTENELDGKGIAETVTQYLNAF
ncbi:MAG: 1-deoxy-D-xylulose-5-phosphate synthase [Treponema sp.]|jgi:1-deoxy-D-xylulose-5-phosphate synthase|nr:1-deoxy-D-xylulose-5-phosphate synthase [Treponema sp.]